MANARGQQLQGGRQISCSADKGNRWGEGPVERGLGAASEINRQSLMGYCPLQWQTIQEAMDFCRAYECRS